MKKNLERLFVYGTLLAPSIRKEVLKREPDIKLVSLPGYTRKIIKKGKSTFSTLCSDATSNTVGLILYITKEELEKFDSYEIHYKRTTVVPEDNIPAWVYILKQK